MKPAILLLSVFSAIIGSLFFLTDKDIKGTGPVSPTHEELTENAKIACKDAVKQTLNDPDSAQFGNTSAAQATDMGLNAWQIKMTLRAKNGFNALTLIEVECQVSFNGSSFITTSVKQLDN